MGTVNERVALRPVIYNSNGPVINVSANSLELRRIIAMMFYKGEQGFFYDPSDLKTQYQDAAGTAAVNATSQPLGLMLDKSKGLSFGSNISLASTATKTADGVHYVTLISDTSYAFKWFDVELVINSLTDALRIFIEGTSGGTLLYFTNLSLGINKIKIMAGPTGVIRLGALTSSRYDISNITIKEVAGNHAYQPTSAARPIFKQKPILGNELVLDGTIIGNPATGAIQYYDTVGKTAPLVAGKTYLITYTISNYTGGSFVGLAGNNPPGLVQFAQARNGTFSTTATITATGYLKFFTRENTTANFTNISVKEVTGYRTDQNYIEYDGVDDKLITNLPAQLNNCTVLRAIPNVGTQVKYNQTLPRLYEDSANHAGLVAINRALTRQEQLRLMDELDKRAGATSLDTLTLKTFDNNQEGFVFDPNDLSTMYQDVAGNIPVTGAGQPVGLMLDKSAGLRYGPELISGGNFESGLIGTKADDDQSISTWELNTVNPISGTSDGLLTITAAAGFRPVLRFSRTAPVVLGKVYEVSFDYKVVSGSVEIGLATAAARAFSRTLSGSGHIKLVYVATTTSNNESFYFRNSVGAVQIDNVSSREIIGNHAYQTVSASRPILRQNATTGAYYLEFDGTDDFLQTSNIDFTATDKVSLFAGVGRLSSVVSSIYELGNTTSAANGTFHLRTSQSAYEFASKGAIRTVVLSAAYPAPTTSVVTSVGDIPNKVTSIRVNGSQLRSNTGDQGASTYGNTPLYIGRRNGTSDPFNGHIYGLIGIGKLTSENESAAIEKELAKRTGVTLNV